MAVLYSFYVYIPLEMDPEILVAQIKELPYITIVYAVESFAWDIEAHGYMTESAQDATLEAIAELEGVKKVTSVTPIKTLKTKYPKR